MLPRSAAIYRGGVKVVNIRPSYTQADLKAGWAEWLQGQAHWSHFATLTFRHRVGWWSANDRLQDWRRRCEGVDSGNDALCNHGAVFGEMQVARGVPHYHALLELPSGRLLGDQDYVAGAVERLWMERNGFARIVPIRSEGACWYTSKYAAKTDYITEFW